MNQELNFYKINEIDNFQFFQLPKALFTSEKYRDLVDGAKIMYSILLDRMNLSKKNKWAKNGNIYIIYRREDIAEYLNLSYRTVTRYFNMLRKFNLVKEKRQGLNRPNLIFVLKPSIEKDEFENGKDNLTYSDETKCQDTNWTIGATPISNTNISNTEKNNNNTGTEETPKTIKKETPKNNVVIFSDAQELDKQFIKVTGKSNIPLLKKLLKRYTSEQIQEKLIYMGKFKKKNVILNPSGFLVASLKNNYTIVDKAKIIFESAEKAIKKSYAEMQEYRSMKRIPKDVSFGLD